MRHIRLMPEIAARLPVKPAPDPIPALQQTKAPPSRHTRETVISAIVAHLSGEPNASIAARIGANPHSSTNGAARLSRRSGKAMACALMKINHKQNGRHAEERGGREGAACREVAMGAGFVTGPVYPTPGVVQIGYPQ